MQVPVLGEARGRGVIVLVHDPDSRPRQAEEILQVGLGLTPGAARLVAALAADDDLKAFAAREGVTIHTARFHLRTALTRTGTKTQSDLVRSAVRLLRDMALRGDEKTRTCFKIKRPPGGGLLHELEFVAISANNIRPPDAVPSEPDKARR